LFLLIFSFVFIWTKWTRWEMNNSFVPIFGCQHVNSAASTLRQKNKRNTFFLLLLFESFKKTTKKFPSIFLFVCWLVLFRRDITQTRDNRMTISPPNFFFK
jgi:hypothetical protein